MFDYDARQPLDIKEVSSEAREGALVRDITFASPYGEPVSAYLVSPRTSGPYPAVLYVHWLEKGADENRTEFLGEAIKLASEGVVSLLVNDLLADWPTSRLVWTGRDADFDRNLVIRQVVELRRALDLLSTERMVDSKRIGFVGHDFGGMFGAVLTAVDRRIKTTVMMTAVPDFGEWFTLKTRLSGPERTSYDLGLKPVAPIEYIREAAPATLFFQFAEGDTFFVPKERALLFFDAASQPKRIEWYSGGHALHHNETATADRLSWLRKEL